MRRKLTIGDKIIFKETVERKGCVKSIDNIGVRIRLFDDDSEIWVARREVYFDKSDTK